MTEIIQVNAVTQQVTVTQPLTQITVASQSDVTVQPVSQTVQVNSPDGIIQVNGLQGLRGDLAASYKHTQTTPASTWTINHNLGRTPSIQLLTVGSVEFFADITHTSLNQAVVTLATATAGIAQCN